MSAPRLLSLLIPAVGGQGGGVLSEWIVDAALEAGLRVHGTSIPGVAQRTGSTTYYVEVYTGRGDEDPAFSLYPVPGALDVLLAPEFLEVGRMIELGFVSPARTTVIASTHRLFSIHEKIATGRAIYPQEALQRAARTAARRLIALDALALAREHRTEANAVLLGALAASEVLPVPEAAFRAAIEGKGVAVRSNLAGFELGTATVRGQGGAGATAAAGAQPVAAAPGAVPPAGAGPPAPTNGAPATGSGGAGGPLPADLDAAVAAMPAGAREVVARGVQRLVDYQDVAYARRYLDLLRPFLPPAAADDRRVALLGVVARYLALWMSYEDAVRVADLKTRAGRFARIRAAARDPQAVVVVTDYLKPDLDEILGVLPDRLVRPLARWAERRWPHGRPTLGQHVRTTTVSGFLRVWLLARLKWLRPVSYRAREEHARIARWLAAVQSSAARDVALAIEVARAAQLVKGYGDVRRRMLHAHAQVVTAALRAMEAEAARGQGFAAATALAAELRALVLEGPDGEARVPAAAAAALARLQTPATSAAAR